MGEALTMESAAAHLTELRKQNETQESEPEKIDEVQEVEETQEQDVQEVETPETDLQQQAQEVTEHQDDANEVSLDADQLAEILGLDAGTLEVDDEGKPYLITKVDGETGKATLKDTLKSYQLDAHLTKRGQEVAELQKQYEEQLSQTAQNFQQQAQQQQLFLDTLEKDFLAPYEGINWTDLKEEDPGSYAAAKQDLAGRKERFKEIYKQAQSDLAEQQSQMNAQFEQQNHQYRQQQGQALMKSVPNWNDEVAQQVTAYLKTTGFTDQEIGNAADARSITMAYKAMLYDQGKETVSKKLVKKLPKVLKPSAKPSKQEVSQVKQNELRSNLKKSGSMQDAAAIFKARKRAR